MKKKYSGIIVPLITPLTNNGFIDADGLERLINHVVGGGVHGIFILGTTGEGPCISRDEKSTLIRQTCLYLKKRVNLFVGITDSSPEETIALARVAAKQGADVVVVAPPPYFPFTQNELFDYIQFVVQHSPLPVMLYNIPKMTKTSFGVETIDRLTNNPGIVGFKDSSKDSAYFREVLKVTKKRPDWSVLTGYEDMLAEAMNEGGDGGVLAGANIYPHVLSSFYRSLVGKDSDMINKIERILAKQREIYSLGTGATSSIQVIKYILEI